MNNNFVFYKIAWEERGEREREQKKADAGLEDIQCYNVINKIRVFLKVKPKECLHKPFSFFSLFYYNRQYK